MLRTFLSIIGIVMVSVPRRLVETAEYVAFENPDEAILRDWTIPMARLEGIGYLLFVRPTRFVSDGGGLVIGLFGWAAVIMPRRYLDFGLSLAYENPDDIDVKPWVIPVTRALGIGALVVTVVSLRDDGDNDS